VGHQSALHKENSRFVAPTGRQRAMHTENSGVASPTLRLGTFPRFVAIFASPTLGQHISTFRGYRILCNSASTHFLVSWLSDFIFYQKPLYKSLHQSKTADLLLQLWVSTFPRFVEQRICHSNGTSESYAYGKQRSCLTNSAPRHISSFRGYICFSNSGSAHFHVSWLSDFVQLCVDTFPRFVAIFYFLSETLI